MTEQKLADQLVLSYELLQLLEWLIENEAESIKKIIKRALSKGLTKKLKSHDAINTNTIQGNVIDFLELMEILLYEANHEVNVSDVIRKNLMPAIDHIDTSNFNAATVESSAAIASTKKEKNPQEDAQELLFKELLKRWKPKKKLTH
jgi:primosomal protein N'